MKRMVSFKVAEGAVGPPSHAIRAQSVVDNAGTGIKAGDAIWMRDKAKVFAKGTVTLREGRTCQVALQGDGGKVQLSTVTRPPLFSSPPKVTFDMICIHAV